MKLSVTVKPNNKKPSVEILSESEWIVRVREPATEGKANDAVLEAIAESLHISKTRVILLRGMKSKQKLVEILL
ncbi:MAG: DUF167 domain-containing protein [Leptospiraceae bacterium]|nr:DUF167 domain-containing protein [Leptospiraceae bacterium]